MCELQHSINVLNVLVSSLENVEVPKYITVVLEIVPLYTHSYFLITIIVSVYVCKHIGFECIKIYWI